MECPDCGALMITSMWGNEHVWFVCSCGHEYCKELKWTRGENSSRQSLEPSSDGSPSTS